MSKINNELKNDPLMPLRHSSEHVLHMSVEALFPGAKKVMGPPIEDGFYHDVDYEGKITAEDFPKIEAYMQRIIDAKLPIKRVETTYEEAKKIFANNPYKLEMIEDLNQKGEKLSFYEFGEKGGEFYDLDLCAGPHVNNTSEIKAFKLMSVAGAYWRGDEKNKMLTRIYATAFDNKEDLQKYLDNLEEAKKRDHRHLGKELDLFTFSPLIGSGLPLYTPRGALIRRLLTSYVEELQTKADYTQVWTPQIAKAELFKISGHYNKYKDDMFKVISNYSDEEFYLKPMNCPQHTQIYNSKPRSYRDLPLRLTDFAMLYRDERPGELNGLARVRAFSQDDCHIFCREDQVDHEIDVALQMIKAIMSTFGFKYRYRLSTRDPQNPDKYLGDPKIWDKVEKWAEDIMKRNEIEYYDGPGEAAFYAPKMDLMATDALGREWQLSTVQIDYVMPERFGLTYNDSDGQEKRPVMLHRAILGSPERLIMILLEHFGGAFPVWLSPVQVQIIPVSEKTNDYAKKIEKELKAAGIRVEINEKDSTMGAKIREAQEQKIPYMLVLGEKEKENDSVSLRTRTGDQMNNIKLGEILEKIKEKIASKSLDL